MNLRWKIAQQAEIRWWQNYLKKRPKADYLSWKTQYWANFLDQINISPSKTDNIIDIGCGPAGIFMLFPDQAVTAVDPLIDAYQEKIEHFNRLQYPNVDFHSLPFEQFETQKQFDVVFCLNAINHVADLGQCFDKLIAITKKGGHLVVSIDAHNYQGFKHLFRTIPGDILHPHQYDLKEYQQMLLDLKCSIQNTVLIKKEFFFNYYCLTTIRKE